MMVKEPSIKRLLTGSIFAGYLISYNIYTPRLVCVRVASMDGKDGGENRNAYYFKQACLSLCIYNVLAGCHPQCR